MRTSCLLSLVICMIVSDGGRLSAEPPMKKKRVEYGIGRAESKSDKKKGKSSTTQITIELLTGNSGNGPKAREWQELLATMDVTLTIRRGRPGEKPEVTELKAGSSRTVQVVGLLDSEGRALFSDRTLTVGENDKVAAWLDELRTYGAQGNPEGQKVWGLTPEQFGVLHAALKRPLAAEPKDLDLEKALRLFELPKDFPLKFNPDVGRLLKDPKGDKSVSQSLQGVSQGTALAVVLLDQGLGFRPKRLPDGSLELTVQSLKEGRDVWPVGWERQQSLPEAAPNLFQFKVVNLEDEPLDEVLEAIAEKAKIPVLIDRAGLAAKGIDFSKLRVTYPRDRTTFINVLKTFTAKARTHFEVKVDEAGKPFIWIAPLNMAERSKKE